MLEATSLLESLAGRAGVSNMVESQQPDKHVTQADRDRVTATWTDLIALNKPGSQTAQEVTDFLKERDFVIGVRNGSEQNRDEMRTRRDSIADFAQQVRNTAQDLESKPIEQRAEKENLLVEQSATLLAAMDASINLLDKTLQSPEPLAKENLQNNRDNVASALTEAEADARDLAQKGDKAKVDAIVADLNSLKKIVNERYRHIGVYENDGDVDQVVAQIDALIATVQALPIEEKQGADAELKVKDQVFLDAKKTHDVLLGLPKDTHTQLDQHVLNAFGAATDAEFEGHLSQARAVIEQLAAQPGQNRDELLAFMATAEQNMRNLRAQLQRSADAPAQVDPDKAIIGAQAGVVDTDVPQPPVQYPDSGFKNVDFKKNPDTAHVDLMAANFGSYKLNQDGEAPVAPATQVDTAPTQVKPVVGNQAVGGGVVPITSNEASNHGQNMDVDQFVREQTRGGQETAIAIDVSKTFGDVYDWVWGTTHDESQRVGLIAKLESQKAALRSEMKTVDAQRDAGTLTDEQVKLMNSAPALESAIDNALVLLQKESATVTKGAEKPVEPAGGGTPAVPETKTVDPRLEQQRQIVAVLVAALAQVENYLKQPVAQAEPVIDHQRDIKEPQQTPKTTETPQPRSELTTLVDSLRRVADAIEKLGAQSVAPVETPVVEPKGEAKATAAEIDLEKIKLAFQTLIDALMAIDSSDPASQERARQALADVKQLIPAQDKDPSQKERERVVFLLQAFVLNINVFLDSLKGGAAASSPDAQQSGALTPEQLVLLQTLSTSLDALFGQLRGVDGQTPAASADNLSDAQRALLIALEPLKALLDSLKQGGGSETTADGAARVAEAAKTQAEAAEKALKELEKSAELLANLGAYIKAYVLETVPGEHRATLEKVLELNPEALDRAAESMRSVAGKKLIEFGQKPVELTSLVESGELTALLGAVMPEVGVVAISFVAESIMMKDQSKLTAEEQELLRVIGDEKNTLTQLDPEKSAKYLETNGANLAKVLSIEALQAYFKPEQLVDYNDQGQAVFTETMTQDMVKLITDLLGNESSTFDAKTKAKSQRAFAALATLFTATIGSSRDRLTEAASEQDQASLEGIQAQLMDQEGLLGLLDKQALKTIRDLLDDPKYDYLKTDGYAEQLQAAIDQLSQAAQKQQTEIVAYFKPGKEEEPAAVEGDADKDPIAEAERLMKEFDEKYDIEAIHDRIIDAEEDNEKSIDLSRRRTRIVVKAEVRREDLEGQLEDLQLALEGGDQEEIKFETRLLKKELRRFKKAEENLAALVAELDAAPKKDDPVAKEAKEQEAFTFTPEWVAAFDIITIQPDAGVEDRDSYKEQITAFNTAVANGLNELAGKKDLKGDELKAALKKLAGDESAKLADTPKSDNETIRRPLLFNKEKLDGDDGFVEKAFTKIGEMRAQGEKPAKPEGEQGADKKGIIDRLKAKWAAKKLAKDAEKSVDTAELTKGKKEWVKNLGKFIAITALGSGVGVLGIHGGIDPTMIRFAGAASAMTGSGFVAYYAARERRAGVTASSEKMAKLHFFLATLLEKTVKKAGILVPFGIGLTMANYIDSAASSMIEPGIGGGPAEPAPAPEPVPAPAEPEPAPKNPLWPPKEPVVPEVPEKPIIGPVPNPHPETGLGGGPADLTPELPAPGSVIELPGGGYSIDGVTFDAAKPYEHGSIWGDVLQNANHTEGIQANVMQQSDVTTQGEIAAGQASDFGKDAFKAANSHLPETVLQNPQGQPAVSLEHLTDARQLEQLQQAADGKLFLVPTEQQQDNLVAFARDALAAAEPTSQQELVRSLNGNFAPNIGEPLTYDKLTTDQLQTVIDIMNGKVK